jgi:hypothetical protein
MGFVPAEPEITTTESMQAEDEVSRRRERQRSALKRLPTLVDIEYPLSDQAWR